VVDAFRSRGLIRRVRLRPGWWVRAARRQPNATTFIATTKILQPFHLWGAPIGPDLRRRKHNHGCSTLVSKYFDAGLEFRFAKGWHGYWCTPGDACVAPTIDWSSSENVARDEVAWPAPHRLVIEGLQNSVYENHVVLPVKLFLNQAGAPTRIRVAVTYAACSDICVPFQAELSLPVRAGATASETALIASARRMVPGTAQAAGIDVVRTHFDCTASEPKLVVDLHGDEPFVRPDLFVEGTGDGIPAAPAVDLQDGGRIVRLTVRLPASAPTGRPLTLTLTDGDRAAEFQVNAR
jgi:suppressor for copper-sensitivity B